MSGIECRFRLAYQQADAESFELDVDLTLPGRGISAIFGASGSGKTTFLRCLAGLERAEGKLSVNGENWQDAQSMLPTYRRPLGYVFQEASLFSHLSAAGNLEFAMKRAGRRPDREAYAHVLDIMGIEALLNRHPGQLSGGERQRVAIARALLSDPHLLLMDEPLASLDFARKGEIMPYLERLHHEFAGPIIYVSHDVNEISQLADHVVLMSGGKALAQGSTGEVFSRIDLPLPADTEAGAILSARVVGHDDHWQLARLAAAGGELWVRDAPREEGDEVRLRILARDVSLANSSHEDSSILNRLPAKVVAIEADGEGPMSLVRLQCGSDYLLARLTRKSVDHLGLRAGSQVWAQIKSAAILR